MSKKLLFLLVFLIPLVSFGQLDVKPNYTKPYFQGSVEVADTLSIDNLIQLKDGAIVKAENGGSTIDLRRSGNNGSIALLGDAAVYLQGGVFGASTTSYISANTVAMEFAMFNSTYTRTGSMSVKDNELAAKTTSNIANFPTTFATQNATINLGLINSSIGSGLNVKAKTNNTTYANQFGFNAGAAFETILNHTTATQDNAISLPNISGTIALISGNPTGDFLPLSGGIMSGNINLSNDIDILMDANFGGTGPSRIQWTAANYIEYDDDGDATLLLKGGGSVTMRTNDNSSIRVGNTGQATLSSGTTALPTLSMSASGSFDGVLTMPNLNALRTWTLPNATGTIALLPSLRNTTITDTFSTANETINCTANTFIINLPSAVGVQGVTYTLINSGSGVITLDADGTETINGSLTINLYQYTSRTVQSDGTNWIIK